LVKTIAAMDGAFPDANVNDFENLIATLDLPDLKDRHILAAALKSNSEVVITFNLKHFPALKLKQHDIEALSPDVFIARLIKQDSTQAINALNSLVNKLKNPPKIIEEVLVSMANCGLVNTAELYRSLL
jgi:hypothetical protein